MDVVKIVKRYLLDNDFEGLCSFMGDCGCEIDDLMPCCGPCAACEPGHKHVADPSTGWDFTISTTEP